MDAFLEIPNEEFFALINGEELTEPSSEFDIWLQAFVISSSLFLRSDFLLLCLLGARFFILEIQVAPLHLCYCVLASMVPNRQGRSVVLVIHTNIVKMKRVTQWSHRRNRPRGSLCQTLKGQWALPVQKCRVCLEWLTASCWRGISLENWRRRKYWCRLHQIPSLNSNSRLQFLSPLLPAFPTYFPSSSPAIWTYLQCSCSTQSHSSSQQYGAKFQVDSRWI